jgi:hypothetical protein
MSQASIDDAGADPIVIYRSVNRDGETFALEPRSQKRIRDAFREAARLRSRLFLAHETRADHEHVLGSIVSQVIVLLTGISEERLRAEVGAVTFRDPVTDRDLPLVPS